MDRFHCSCNRCCLGHNGAGLWTGFTVAGIGAVWDIMEQGYGQVSL